MTQQLSTSVAIRPAKLDDVESVADLIGQSFAALPASSWLIPEPADRRAVLAGNFAIWVEHALAHGHVDLVEDGSAAAVWFTEMAPPPDYHRRLEAACGPYTNRFRVLDALFDTFHPVAPRHWYLAMIAVRPDLQASGRGSDLLRHRHQQLDEEAVPAYLEAASPVGRDLFARHGYRPFGGAFCLPDETPFWPMWRSPVRP